MIDTYDDYSPNNPINQTEYEKQDYTEQEEIEYYNSELTIKVSKLERKLLSLKEDIEILRDLSRGFSSNYLSNKLQEILSKNNL
tara:strand:+ start:388 stop:639 length:252 start_codon:yes stop_codon:yes gene_type:complete